jgi:hypothetical protein
MGCGVGVPWLQHLAPFDCVFQGEALGVAARLNALGGAGVQFEWSDGALGALDYEGRVAACRLGMWPMIGSMGWCGCVILGLKGC